MGSNKGQSTSNTSQNQSYTPAGGGYIQNALNRAGQASNLPFNIPQAPVAGFSQDQQNAFQNVNNAQGMAQPYINQAQNYFQQSAQRPDVASFYNPMAANVTAQMQNIFGQQNQQNTANLTQAAGGVGADRIAVGQGNLANQQGLAAGQTYANLWQQAQGAAQQQQNVQQGAGYGTAALGSQAQNAALQGAQAQLGTGGLQQQLSQAQMNSPYQQQLAQAAFPYQQAQFLAGITGSLAPGLGGTTQGTGTTNTTPAQPSIWSQILGGGTAAAGIYGGLSGKGSGGAGYQNSTGNYMGMTNQQQDDLQDSGFNLPNARGGAVGGYAEGGATSDEPIDIAPKQIIPSVQSPSIQPHIPQLNLNPPPAPSGGGSGSSAGDIAKMGLQIAGMFMKRGGRAFADGGAPSPLDEAQWPYGPEGGPSALDAAQWPSGPVGGPSDVVNFGDPIRRDPQADDNWRTGANADRANGLTATDASSNPFRALAAKAGAPAAAPAADAGASAPAGAGGAGDPEPPARDTGFAGSPWAALMAAGLGTMAGTSPFAGVNIGQGGLQGLKALEQQRSMSQKDETIDQAAKRLALEAKHHEDQYTRSTPSQQFEMSKPFAMGQRIDPITGQTMTTFGTRQPDGSIKPVDPTAAPANPAQAAADDAALPANAKSTQGFLIPGKNVPDNVDPSVLAGQDPGLANIVRAIDEGRESISKVPMKQRYMVQRLLNAYDPGFDGTVWTLRNKQQGDLATNGTAGKMLTAVNQLLPHLSTAFDRADKLANTNYPEANTIKNWWLTATGDPRVKEFATVREVAAMDAARLLRGTGQMAEKDIEAWRENIASQGSPQQLKGVITLLADDLIGARISSLQHEYRQNMRQEPPEFLSPEAKGALAKIKTGAAPAAGAQPASAAAPAAAAGAAPAEQPPAPGARKAPDGHWYVQQNGKYFRVDQ